MITECGFWSSMIEFMSFSNVFLVMIPINIDTSCQFAILYELMEILCWLLFAFSRVSDPEYELAEVSLLSRGISSNNMNTKNLLFMTFDDSGISREVSNQSQELEVGRMLDRDICIVKGVLLGERILEF
ncbi:hypothetical protein Tco_1312787 [Tanacetum coccineum]